MSARLAEPNTPPADPLSNGALDKWTTASPWPSHLAPGAVLGPSGPVVLNEPADDPVQDNGAALPAPDAR